MKREESIVHYLLASMVVNRWLSLCVITEEEHTKLNEQLAAQYGIPSNSIYRKISCNLGLFK